MTKRPVLILGGGSDIGLAIARRFAAESYPIQLAARRPDELEPERADIALRHGVEVTLHRFDALEIEQIEAFFDNLPDTPGVVVCAVGLLGDQAEAEGNPRHARLVAETNFIGPMCALECAAARLAKLNEETAIIGISSVAGDRGRAVNYWYGASKAALTAALSGMGQCYAGSKLHVMTVKPGFVATKMTAGLDLPGALVADPAKLANLVYASFLKKTYTVTPLIWRLIMLIIKNIPEGIFRKFKRNSKHRVAQL
ncbi:MAG: SDR family oxidoreductase [Alphaproteobacteria bacterium]|nr:SDR family oxidoreductase [Alphaproteobacteria bacterium]